MTEAPPSDERVLVTIPTGRLVGAIALSDYGLITEALAIAVVVTAIESPGRGEGPRRQRLPPAARDAHRASGGGSTTATA